MTTHSAFAAASRRGRLAQSLSAALLSALAFATAMPGPVDASPTTEFQVPSPDAAPVGIAAGPAQTMWFAENTGFAVGRVDSAGNVTEFAVPAASTGSHGSLNSITEGAIRVTGYLTPPANPDGLFTLQPPLSGQELASQPVPVSGGLLGTIPLLGPIVGPLTGPANELTVSLTLAGPVELGLSPLGATVPITLHLNNLLLGTNCIVGPVVEHLVLAPTAAGTGDPAMSWGPVPVAGSDQTFSVPGASGCGAIPALFDAVIDLQLGLPSSSGNNSAQLPAVLSVGAGVHP